MPTINALLVRYDGGYFEALDASSIAASGFGVRRESLLSVADMRSPDEATRVASSTLASYARTRTAVEANLEPLDSSEVPYIGFDVGDTVTVDDETDTPAPSRVQAISVSEDEEGVVIWTPEMGDIIDDPGSRTTRWLRRMDNGTLAGRSESAQPLQVPITRRLSAPPRGGKPYATYVVAAFDSYAPGFREADYICNGLDAAPTINTAVAAIDPNLGGRILLLEGTYPLLTPIVLAANATDGDITLEGQGYATHLRADAATQMIIGDWSHEQIANLRVDGNGFATVGIDFDLGSPGTYHRVRSCWIHGCTAGILPADLVSLRITDCDIYGNVYGFYEDRPEDLQILDCRFESNGEHIHLNDPSDASDANSALIKGNVFRDASSLGIYTRSRWAIIADNLFKDNANQHVDCFHGLTETVQVHGNRFLGGTGGVRMDETSRNMIHDNYFQGQTIGVEIRDDSDSNSVRGNMFASCTTGVSINANLCNDNVVRGNDFRSCGADISDAGTATSTGENTTA